MPLSLAEEYADSLAELTGNEFQDEVCARLQSAILSFQTVPAKPRGDAGLDGFSHNGDRGYCCYGPLRDKFTRNQDLVTDIVNKFRKDLRRLCELDVRGRTQVVFCIDNLEMATILPDGQKLKHIDLIVNWFESHRVLNPISTAFNKYKVISVCRYVDADASVRILGPKQLATQYAVDADMVFRAQQRGLIQRVQQTAQKVEIKDPKDFDYKMGLLHQIRPDQRAAIDSLRDRLRSDWRTALAFDRELDETLPGLHRTLEHSRKSILTRVSALMVASNQPWSELIRASQTAQEILERDFGTQYGPLLRDVGSGEIARLIGECPVGWERTTPSK